MCIRDSLDRTIMEVITVNQQFVPRLITQELLRIEMCFFQFVHNGGVVPLERDGHLLCDGNWFWRRRWLPFPDHIATVVVICSMR